MSRPSRRLPLVFVDDLDAPVVREADDRHLRRSLRMQPGDALTLADGVGGHRRARLAADSVELEGAVEHEAARERRFGVAFAPVKAQKPEWVAAKLTELGLDVIQLVVAERSVVRWDDGRARKAVERMQVSVREASMQCRRARLPEVGAPMSLDQLRSAWPAGLALAEPGNPAPDDGVDLIVVGPEGGWSPEEVAAGPALVGLPGRILRAETAAIVAGALLAQAG